MTDGATPGSATGEPEALDAVLADLRRLPDRLRSAPVARAASAAAHVRAALQVLADLAQGTDARAEAAPPPWRTVPALPDPALGDQLEVLGLDLVQAVRGLDGTVEVWSRTGRTTLGAGLRDAATALREIRAAL